MSFSRAADELSLTPSAVSHGIRALEEWLGVALFVRTGRGLQLTLEGTTYYPVVREALALLSHGSERLRRPSGMRRVALSVAPAFARRWLLPRLSDFRTRHPEIGVVVDTMQDLADLEGRAVDLAIRMGRGGWPGLFADPILTESLVPVCAPHLCESDLEALPLIHVSRLAEEWAAWARISGRELPDPDRGLRFDTLQMAFDAAAQGLGVAMGRKPLVDEELASGRLVVAWEPVVESTTTYWLVGLQARAGEPDIRIFRDWLRQQGQQASPEDPAAPGRD